MLNFRLWVGVYLVNSQKSHFMRTYLDVGDNTRRGSCCYLLVAESCRAYTLSLKVVVSNTHEFHPKLKARNRQFSRYMKLIFSESL